MKTALRLIPVALVSILFGFAGAWLFAMSGLGGSYTRDWLVSHPEILPEIAEAYQAQQAKDRLAQVGDVTKPFPGAVMGNPNGTVTLVEFSDYGCGFCRRNVPEVKALIAANPQLKVVVREWPIFQGSDVAARMALVAAQQGKYRAFHDAMYAAGGISQATILAAARTAGVDLEQAKQQMGSQAVEFELRNNQEIARQLGFEGTPMWIANGKVLTGYVTRQQLAEALDLKPGA